MTYPYSTNKPTGTPGWARLSRTPTQATAPAPVPVPNTQPEGRNFAGPDGEWSWARFAEWAPYGILGSLGNAANQGIDDIYGSMGQYRDSRLNAINALGPGGAKGLVDAFRQRTMGAANEAGRENAALLRSRGITGQEGAAALDARNRAADATNAYDADLNSPEKVAQRFIQQMQLSSPEAAAPIMQLINALFGPAMGRTSMNNQEHAQRAQSSGLGGILGNVLGMATGGGFGNLASIFGRQGGGTGGTHVGHGVYL